MTIFWAVVLGAAVAAAPAKKPATAPLPPAPAAPRPAVEPPPSPTVTAAPEAAVRSGARRPKIWAGMTAGPGFYLGEKTAIVSASVALKLAPEVQVEWAMTPELALQAALPVTIHLAQSQFTFFGITQRYNTAGFEIVPTGRVLYELIPNFRILADFGIGFARYSTRTRVQFMGEIGADVGTAQVTLGFGGSYRLHERIAIFARPLLFRFIGGGRVHAFGPNADEINNNPNATSMQPGYTELGMQVGGFFSF